MPAELDRDWRLRLAAFAKLDELRRAHGIVRAMDLDAGFEFEGERIRFWSERRGIWRPRQIGSGGAALTIVTTPEKPGKRRPYDDQIASDDGWFVYRYEGTNPDLWTNRAVRQAMLDRRPLIYLYGDSPGLYDAIFPAYVVGDDPQQLAFDVAADVPGKVIAPPDQPDLMLAARRGYETVEVKKRLHQRRFRELVVAAYASSCTVCRIRHAELLDAAHILPDRDVRGRPEVPNGLSLCKIHHAAYDTGILSVAPDYAVHIRRDVLDEHDGPMLRHGLQEMEGVRIRVPRRPECRPNPEFLEERYRRFLAA